MIVRGYGLGEEVGVRLPKGNEMARLPGKGYVAVFESQLKLGLRFPVFQLLQEVIKYYGVSIIQLFPLGICIMVAFEMACREAKVESSLTLFRHFYHLKRTGGFYYVCGRSLGKDFLARNKGLQSGWRTRYFMVKKGSFPRGVGWKEGSSSDLKPDAEIVSLDLEKLELVKPILLSSVKSRQLEETGLWVRPAEPLQEKDSGSASRAGINSYVMLKKA